MCGSKSSKVEKPTVKPTTNLVAVDATQGTSRRANISKYHRANKPRPGATMLTGE